MIFFSFFVFLALTLPNDYVRYDLSLFLSLYLALILSPSHILFWHVFSVLLGDPEVTANIYCKSRNLPNTDTQNYSTELR